MMKFRSAQLMVFVCASWLVLGCAPTRAYRTVLVDPGSVNCPTEKALERCSNITPETAPGYELHFVEFDDQGWAVSTPAGTPAQPGVQSPSQTDHLMKRLDKLLGEERRYLNIILYVHGWKHDAKDDDEDVKRFRQILASARTLESSKSQTPRKVVGIYVGWRGKPWNLPNAIVNLSFWSRKSAALRVSHGAVQELFSRLRTVQRHYNSNLDSPDCAAPRDGRITTSGCRVRMLMIGHSFGAWILYSAISGPLISTLNAEKDLDGTLSPGSEGAAKNATAIKDAGNRRPADLIVLINPAFEAVRYQPLHQAAINYKSKVVQPPLLVTITSSADSATRIWFPAGRFINSIFERPVTSDEQSEAMKRTHGHIELYQTHKLVARANQACPGWTPPGALHSSNREVTLKNKAIEELNSARFFQANTDATGLLKQFWTREFCGGVTLSQMTASVPNQNRDPNSLVWNIHTDDSLIKSHSDIMGEQLIEFVRQLYDDTELRW